MRTFEFGIDKTIRCYVRVSAASPRAAARKLRAFIDKGPLHLIDQEQQIDYTDTADDAPRFDTESMDYLHELDAHGKAMDANTELTRSGREVTK